MPAALIENLPALRNEAKASLVPAEPQEMAVFLEMMQQTAAALRWPALAQGAARIYVVALGDVPADLLALALTRLQRDWKWARMPSPADVREAIADELGTRKLRLTRLRTVEIFGRR